MTITASVERLTGEAWPRGNDFRPRGLLANSNVQTVLASSVLRHVAQDRLRRALAEVSEPVVFALPHGVRLSGVVARQHTRRTARGLAVLLHGWEGSVHSGYLVQTAARLLADGWDVFRLNFRDHGGSHHLNAGLFHSCRLDEVVDAVHEAAQRWQACTRPLALVGFSLGGNFALRVALAAPAKGLAIDRVVAVCPVIDPGSGLFSLERGPWIYHGYFMRKWAQSLRRKERLFPYQYHFRATELRSGLRSLTRAMVERYTDFGSLENYLDGYSLAGTRMAGMRVPATILAARDDPVIPVADFAQLAIPPTIELDIANHGGHCGFLMDCRLRVFTDGYIATRLNALAP